MRGQRGRITVDRSATGVVVVCSDCPSWYGVGDDALAGWTVAAEHEQRVHRPDTSARNTLATMQKRQRVRDDRAKIGA